MTATLNQLDDFTRAYLKCILWAETDESTPSGGEPLDGNYGLDDFAPEALEKAVADCRRFQEENAADIAAGPDTPNYNRYAHAGSDFWLTRNGHGCGFWDGDWPKEIGERLTAAAEKMGESYVTVGDGGLIYLD